MTAFIIEKPDGSREPIFAGAMVVENGHLLAKRFRADDRETEAAWAPGSWVTFKERLADDNVERQRLFIEAIKTARDALPPGVVRDWAEQELMFAEAYRAANEMEVEAA